MQNYHKHPDTDPEHDNHVNDFINNKEQNMINDEYMLTIARDGESPVRAIYRFGGAENAINAYNEYKDWGFAKKFLTVTLYHPNGKKSEKQLNAPLAGDCVFVREQYVKIAEDIYSIKKFVPEIEYNDLVNKLALLFSQDNWRFDPVRFFNNSGSSLTEAIE
jgi:hypothetical protein